MPRLVLLGLGGLGCPALLALAEGAARASLPLTVALVDPDLVEISNLPRQILFRDADRGRLKVEAARDGLRRLLPAAPLELELHPVRFDASSAPMLLEGAALLLDGTDDVPTRFLANDLACAARLPLVHGAAIEWTGQLLTVLPGKTACLRCLFEGPPRPGAVPACSEAGVLSPLCGVVGAWMAREALALLMGVSPESAGLLLRWETLEGRARPVTVPRDPECAACGTFPSHINDKQT